MPAATTGKTPAKGAAKSAKAASAKRHHRRSESFNIYIYKVLQQCQQNKMGMSKKAMAVMNSFIYDLFERIATEAGRVCQYNKRRTLDARAVRCAARLVLPGELSKHAEDEANNAILRFFQSNKRN